MMEECIKDNTKTIRNMALESIPGLIKDVMKVIGLKESSMDWVHMLCQRITKSSLVSGKMENAFSGSMRLKYKPSTMAL